VDASIDDFPSTQRTWLLTQIGALDGSSGGANSSALDAIRSHIFERYEWPLSEYVRNSSVRRLGEPDEIVHGYLVKLLRECASLQQWMHSGRPLRRWLLTGLLFHARGLQRDAARARKVVSLDAGEIMTAPESTAEHAFERAWGRRVLEAAFDLTENSMNESGHARQWEIFRRHVLLEQAYAPIAQEFGVSVQQCADASRISVQRLRAMLQQVLLDEGITPKDSLSEVERIIRSTLGGATF